MIAAAAVSTVQASSIHGSGAAATGRSTDSGSENNKIATHTHAPSHSSAAPLLIQSNTTAVSATLLAGRSACLLPPSTHTSHTQPTHQTPRPDHVVAAST